MGEEEHDNNEDDGGEISIEKALPGALGRMGPMGFGTLLDVIETNYSNLDRYSTVSYNTLCHLCFAFFAVLCCAMLLCCVLGYQVFLYSSSMPMCSVLYWKVQRSNAAIVVTIFCQV